MSILFWIVVGVFSYSMSLQAQEDTEPPSIEEQIFEQIGPLTLLDLAPLDREEIIEKLRDDLNVHVQTPQAPLFDRYFLSYIYSYFSSMKPDSFYVTPYNLYAEEHQSQKLVSRRSENDLYFSKNAGDRTITKSVKSIMDAVFNQEVLPDEIQMTFEYNNELYAQLNSAILSSEDIKKFMNKHSGIVFFDEFNNKVKPFTRDELLMVLKQYLDLPVHIRDNLALKKVVRVKSIVKSFFHFFSITVGEYNSSTDTITLTDHAFNKENTDDKGEGTFLHEVGHALWGKSLWKGLSQEAKREYEKLSWQGGKQINDEFISDYSATNIHEDFAEHFSAYINNGEAFKHEVTSKYEWFREHIFLNVEYITDVAGHLKIFVESEHGDTSPPYFIGLPYSAFEINITVNNPKEDEDFWKNGSAQVRVQVNGLFDDKSEIKHIGILLQSKKDYFWLHSHEYFRFCNTTINELKEDQISEKCIFIDPNTPGLYVFYISKQLALSYSGDYRITQVKLEDKAGNKKTLRSDLGDAVIPFPGTKDKIEEAERKEKERLAVVRRRLERGQAQVEEEARRKEAAKEAEGFNLLNLSESPVRLEQNEEELRILEFGECISMMEKELSSLRLTALSGWFDWELDSLICSNTDEDESRCRINATSLIKQNENGYMLANYRDEFSADFSQCKLSPYSKAEKGRKGRMKKVSEEINGFNIANLSNKPLRIYQGQQDVLDLEPQKCVRVTKQELSSLSLKTKGNFFSWASVCSNNDRFLNIPKCDVHSASVVKQNTVGDYILTDYQGEESVDFYNCGFLTKNIESVLGDLAEEARRKRSAQEVEGFNLLNLSENPVRLEQNKEELRTLESGECISMLEEDLSSLRLKVLSGWFDWELDSLICSNTDKDESQCRINKTSLIKEDENGEYVLADYQEEFSADFRRCRPSPSKKEESDRKRRMDKTSKEMEDFNIFNLSDLSIRVYQGEKAILDLEPQKCVRMNAQELLDISLRQERGSFICTNIENPLNIYKCNITSASLITKNADEEYVLTDYQGEESADFSQCTPLVEDEDLFVQDKKEQDLLEKALEEEQEKEKIEDNTPPYLLNSPSESISVSVNNYGETHAVMKVEINGLFDDMSNIRRIDVNMNSENDYIDLDSPSDLCLFNERTVAHHFRGCLFYVRGEAGRYVYYRSIKRTYSYPGDYKVTEIKVSDTSFNKIEYDIEDSNAVYFPGTKLLVDEESIKEDLEIKTSKTSDGDTIAHILTTDMTVFERDFYINIINKESEEEYQYFIDVSLLDSLNDRFKSPSVSGKMSLPIIIPKELSSGRYRVNWISFGYGVYHVLFPESHPNNYFDHISYEEDTLAQPIVDDIAMGILKGENEEGGDTSIRVDIPIEGLDGGEGSADVIVRTPTGDHLSFSTRLAKGSRSVSAVFHLPPRHAEGEYKVTHISTTEDYGDAVNRRINHRGLKLSQGGKRVHSARLLERTIRTTLDISTPPPPQAEKKH